MVEDKVVEKKIIKKAEIPTGKLPDGIIGEVRLKDANIFNCTHILYAQDIHQYICVTEEGEDIFIPADNVSFIYHHKIA
ncbi:MAG: hypothetical protein KAJ10_05225 [Thermodesulfovibrionia bacterium]|nr:hypothetical protein [Thermodesulfovibrionia bacterium]